MTVRVPVVGLIAVGVVVIVIAVLAVHHVRPVVVIQSIPAADGKPQAQSVMPATVSGKSTMCNGHEIAPTATGCTADGGVVFASPPATLTKNGKDQ